MVKELVVIESDNGFGFGLESKLECYLDGQRAGSVDVTEIDPNTVDMTQFE